MVFAIFSIPFFMTRWLSNVFAKITSVIIIKNRVTRLILGDIKTGFFLNKYYRKHFRYIGTIFFKSIFFFFEKTPKNIYFYLKKDVKKRHTLNHLWLKWMEELILTVSSLSCNTFKLVSNIYYQNVTTRVPIQWYRNINYLETSSCVFLFFLLWPLRTSFTTFI